MSLTATITSLRDTPEEDIVQAIGRSNGVYLMSATGGLSGVSSGAFNVGQLQRQLQAKGGHFSDMTDVELEVVSAKAIELIARRERQVTILNDDDPALGFEVSGDAVCPGAGPTSLAGTARGACSYRGAQPNGGAFYVCRGAPHA